jgi:hypothetical protein
LDFILDTAANVNTLHGAVAHELHLPVVGQALPGIGAAGALAGGATYALGDAQLEGVPGFNATFITGLTAAALPIASPAAAGLLSLAFLQSFDGVEFTWGNRTTETYPAITFYSTLQHMELELKQKVHIQRIPITNLPSIVVEINGVSMPALLDTGSPITVLNAAAAKRIGIDTTVPVSDKNDRNPFQALTRSWRQGQAASQGQVLQIMGTGGKPVSLIQSTQPPTVHVPTANGGSSIDFGAGHVYVGDLPGLAALNGLGVSSPPAVVLGMDVLRRRPSMLLRASHNEVWF